MQEMTCVLLWRSYIVPTLRCAQQWMCNAAWFYVAFFCDLGRKTFTFTTKMLLQNNNNNIKKTSRHCYLSRWQINKDLSEHVWPMTVQWYEVSNTLLTMSNFSNLDIQYEHCNSMLHFSNTAFFKEREFYKCLLKLF